LRTVLPCGVQDIEKNIRVLEMAAETGAPVVTFYDSTGAKLEGGLDLLHADARLTAEIARVSGVLPQVAVVTGTCAGANAGLRRCRGRLCHGRGCRAVPERSVQR
jgi:Acetyl-CoA carboxylase, carboxyltransferase component (subunits alpha and beta)